MTEEKMSMFPQKQKWTSRLVKSEDLIELFCICHMPEIHQWLSVASVVIGTMLVV